MSRRVRSLLAVSLVPLVCATACATIFRGTSQKVRIASTPPGAAAVIFPGGRQVTTPAEVKLPREKAQTIRIEMAGYEPAWSYLDRQATWDAFLPYLGNILIGGVIGMVVDLNSGALLELAPTPVDVVLQPVEEAPPASAAAEPPATSIDPP